ncbi:hypothetical protein PVAP13_5NG254381 [Panicum virgatum]|uniref:Uncharacterized protein n=1 Tax=Panicum virgatum TaxID=38727 RepID=A0A8T0RWN7_PANVG|nr:hypothetical protein PVAP13_5NG254381 [Panicum virgatum]
MELTGKERPTGSRAAPVAAGRRHTGTGGDGQGRLCGEEAAGRRRPDLARGGDEAASAEETGAVDEVGHRGRWRGGRPGAAEEDDAVEEGARAGEGPPGRTREGGLARRPCAVGRKGAGRPRSVEAGWRGRDRWRGGGGGGVGTAPAGKEEWRRRWKISAA